MLSVLVSSNIKCRSREPVKVRQCQRRVGHTSSSFRGFLRLPVEIELDVLRFLDRDALDRYQLVDSAKHLLVERHRRQLALRSIDRIALVNSAL